MHQYFGDYPADFFDLIVIDECHRGGANDESSWRDIHQLLQRRRCSWV